MAALENLENANDVKVRSKDNTQTINEQVRQSGEDTGYGRTMSM